MFIIYSKTSKSSYKFNLMTDKHDLTTVRHGERNLTVTFCRGKRSNTEYYHITETEHDERRSDYMQYEKEHYTLTEISNKISRSRSTIADWYRVFAQYFPTKGEGRTKRFHKDSIELFLLIAKMKDNNEPNETIENVLRSMVDEIIIDPEEDTPHVPMLTELFEGYQKTSLELESVRRQNELLAEQNEMILRELQSFKEAAATVEQNRVDRDKLLLETMRQIQADKQQEPKGFFARLFGK